MARDEDAWMSTITFLGSESFHVFVPPGRRRTGYPCQGSRPEEDARETETGPETR